MADSRARGGGSATARSASRLSEWGATFGRVASAAASAGAAAASAGAAAASDMAAAGAAAARSRIDASSPRTPSGAAAAPPPTFKPAPPPMTPEQRVARFKRLLQMQSKERFKHVCFVEGVPDDGSETASLRAIAWKLLLGYLPDERSEWQPFLAEQRKSYQLFCEELTVDPQASAASGGGDDADDPLTSSPPLGDPLSGGDGAGTPTSASSSSAAAAAPSGGSPGSDVPAAGAVELDAADHPLTSTEGSRWLEWHADEDLRHEIRKDVDRTLPDYNFFNVWPEPRTRPRARAPCMLMACP